MSYFMASIYIGLKCWCLHMKGPKQGKPLATGKCCHPGPLNLPFRGKKWYVVSRFSLLEDNWWNLAHVWSISGKNGTRTWRELRRQWVWGRTRLILEPETRAIVYGFSRQRPAARPSASAPPQSFWKSHILKHDPRTVESLYFHRELKP